MKLIPEILDRHEEMKSWRRDLHAHPETAFEEERTSDFVASRLEKFGLKVRRGLARTGVVGTLENGSGRKIGLRADMDALDIRELNTFDHKSRHEGKMHACGHDGHTTMLLGAAEYLATRRNFQGSIYFIFQPAEENEGGGRVMVEEGLFDEFPAEAIFGLHNWPGIPAGVMAVQSGPIMASYDVFTITVQGRGAHAAMPHLGRDPIPVAAEIISALQRLVSRETNPLDSAVVSVTQIRAGDAFNVIPETAELKGTVRCFRPEVQDRLEERIKQVASGIAGAAETEAKVVYERRYPATINHPKETEFARGVALEIAGPERFIHDLPPSMGSEDFSFMLGRVPGCYARLGNGPGEGGCILHSPFYDFNDDVLPIGASYFARLAEAFLNE